MKRYWWVIITLILVALRFWISTTSYNNDMNNHFNWTNSLKNEGFAGFYERDYSPFSQANYPPLTNILFYLADINFDKLEGQPVEIKAALYKLPAISIETIATVVMSVLISPLLFLILLINPGIFYNTLLWGQTEGLMAGFIVISLFFTHRKKPLLAWLMFLLALLSKQSAIIFLPLLALINYKSFGIKKNIVPVFISAIIFALMFIPFYPNRFIDGAYSFLIEQSAGQQHWGSVNALNFWYLIGKNEVSDSTLFNGLSYRTIGILLTGLAYIYIAFLIFKSKIEFKNSLIMAGLVNFAVFLFMTRIHERHLLPTLIFLAPIALVSYSRFLLYGAISAISFVNMYLIWHERFHDTNFTYLAVLSLVLIAFFFTLLAIYRPKSAKK